MWRRPTLPGVTPVPSALRGLTSLFGMGRGGAPALGRLCLLAAGRVRPGACVFVLFDGFRRRRGVAAGRPRFRAISTARLWHRCLYTCGLSTSSSLTALFRSLISGRVSHLDAFSAYPFPTWLPGGAVGTTTGTPAVGPARSSRTKARPPQTSHARNR